MGHPIDIAGGRITPQTGSGDAAQGMRLEARQRLEDMHHERSRYHRRDEINERQAEECCDHDPPEEYAETKTVARRFGRGGIEPSERDHLEILPAQKISVEGEEEN